MFLLAVTLPNLYRDLPTPQISGPQQIARNASEYPPSNTQTTDASTSETVATLNLNDFPHLSPTLRSLTQAWLDQCTETDLVVSAITDADLRAQALEFLKHRGKMRLFLNLPLEWENLTYEESFKRLFQLSHNKGPYGRNYLELQAYLLQDWLPKQYAGGDERIVFLKKCADFSDAFGKEMFRFSILENRMRFEFGIESRHWNQTIWCCYTANSLSHYGYLTHPHQDEWQRKQWDEVNTWDEESYCLRQMGWRGLVYLTDRSYQRALDNQMDEKLRRGFLYKTLTAPGIFVALRTTIRPSIQEIDNEFTQLQQRANGH